MELLQEGLEGEATPHRDEGMGDMDDDKAADGTSTQGLLPSPVLDPTTVRWQRSYDRASVERFAAEVEAHRARLRAEIDAARAAADLAATQGAGPGTSPADLGELVVAAQRELEQLEREHRETVDAIRDAAEAEAERVLAAARAEVEAVRSSASAISALIDGGDEPEEAKLAFDAGATAPEAGGGAVRAVDAS